MALYIRKTFETFTDNSAEELVEAKEKIVRLKADNNILTKNN